MAIPALQAFIGTVGPTSQQDGATPAVRLGRTGELITDELHGRYYESTYRKQMYSGSVIGTITSAGLTTTFLGLALFNPNGSGVNVVVNKFGYSFAVAFAAASAIGLATGFSTSVMPATNAVTTRSQFFIGGQPGVAGLTSGATLPAAPTVNMLFGTGFTGAITTVPLVPMSYVDLEGSLILPPGAYACSYTSTASGAASGSFSFQWEEVLV